jgi:hypothetical protein
LYLHVFFIILQNASKIGLIFVRLSIGWLILFNAEKHDNQAVSSGCSVEALVNPTLAAKARQGLMG